MNIIELAEKSGIQEWWGEPDECYDEFCEMLERFAVFVRAEALEEAAKVCDEFVEDMDFDCDMTLNEVGDYMAKYCAAAIRGLK